MSLADSLQAMEMFSPLLGKVPQDHLRYLLHRLKNEKPHRFKNQLRLNTFFPPYPSPAFDRFCEAVAERKRVPLSLYQAITDVCPFRCAHCSYAGRPSGAMSHETLLDVIAQIKALGTCTIGFTGGEPLMRDDLEDFIAAAGPEMATLVFTTGFSLDAARARRLADSGVTCVTIGLESSKAEEHDAVRGMPGSFDMAHRAIDLLNEAGVYTAFSTIGKREKIASGELERMYEMGVKWHAKEFRLLAPVATGAMAGCAASMLTNEEYQYLYNFHIQHNCTPGDGPVVASFAYLESSEMFGCGAGYHHTFIDANGEVCPCDLTPLSFGNATREPLADIWKRMGEHFSKPRCGCMMGKIAEKSDLSKFKKFPLSPDQSLSVCPKQDPNDPLPEGYRRLLGN
jgi:MoaA/NifB/PqqE/SkfB family radical SAM enzyme